MTYGRLDVTELYVCLGKEGEKEAGVSGRGAWHEKVEIRDVARKEN